MTQCLFLAANVLLGGRLTQWGWRRPTSGVVQRHQIVFGQDIAGAGARLDADVVGRRRLQVLDEHGRQVLDVVRHCRPPKEAPLVTVPEPEWYCSGFSRVPVSQRVSPSMR